MRVAVVTTYDMAHPEEWPGGLLGLRGFARRLVLGLARCGLDVVYAGPVREKPWSRSMRLRHLLHRLTDRRYLPVLETEVLDDWARQLAPQIHQLQPDVVLCPENCLTISRLRLPYPMVLWTDANLINLVDQYTFLTNLSAFTRRNLLHTERDAVNRCQHVVYCCQWAADEAVRLYGLSPDRVSVVPHGAVLESRASEAEVQGWIDARAERPIKILFAAMEWLRKGGDRALALASALQAAGLEVELTLVGRYPARDWPQFVRLEGLVDIRTPAGEAHMRTLMQQSHLLLLPARLECFGLVLAEANSFGVPGVATAVGGIPTAIRDGVNGLLVDPDLPPEAWVPRLLPLLTDRSAYRKMALAAWREYRERLNWDTSAAAGAALLRRIGKP